MEEDTQTDTEALAALSEKVAKLGDLVKELDLGGRGDGHVCEIAAVSLREFGEVKATLHNLAARLADAGIAMPEQNGIEAIDVLVTQFKQLQSERDTLRQELAEATGKAEAQALKDASKAKATPSARRDSARALGPLKGKKEGSGPSGEELLAAIAVAETVEIGFSDGKREIKALPAQLIQGDAWQAATNGIRLRVDKLQIFGPNREESAIKLAGYALLLDGEQVAYSARMDVLTLSPGGTYDLKDDVIF